MRSLLFLIPLIFLSSCSIDWNDEKQIKETPITQIQNQKLGKTPCRNSDVNCQLSQICNSIDDHGIIQSGSGDSSLEFSTIVKMGDKLFYFQNTDSFPMDTGIEKSVQKKGYIYVFKEYNCPTNEEKELVSSGTMLKVLDTLPKEEPFAYWPDIFGYDVFDDTNFSFFGGVLRFVYAIGNDEGGRAAQYNITINTHTIDNAADGSGYVDADAISIGGSRYDDEDKSKVLYQFSTGVYCHKNESPLPQ